MQLAEDKAFFNQKFGHDADEKGDEEKAIYAQTSGDEVEEE